MRAEILATAFLVVMAAIPLIVVTSALRPGNYTFPQKCLLVMAYLLTRLLWRSGKPATLPIGQHGAVIVSNHRSSVDPFFLQVCADRPIRWLVAREYCEHPLFRWFLATCNVIPVNRGGIDTAATKTAIRCVKEGGVVGMFPEGRINMSDEFMLPVRPGAVLVAMKAGAPLVPCYVEGSPYDRTPWSPFLMRARVKVHFGSCVHLEQMGSSESQDDVIRRVMAEVVQQISELAGQPDYELQFAGRRWKPTADELAEAMAGPRRAAPE